MTSYRSILKSSALIGGSSVINVLLGIVRTKVLAVLIGTDGMGLFGTLSSVTALVSGIAGMGVNTSGVRQIAEAVGSNDQQRIARTVLTLRRTSVALGFAGMVAMLVLCSPLSKLTFGDTSYAGTIALLAPIVLFTEVSAGQAALIQGLRRIRDLAALTIWAAVLATAISIPVIFLFRDKGIAAFLVTVSALGIATSWWYARKVEVDRVSLPASVVWTEARTLLRMGLVFMASGLMVSGVAYATRVLVIRELGLPAAGLYQAAWAISGVYVGFVLGAMGADYYPRLTGVANDHAEVNRLVNEQTEASILMAVPGILGTLAFAPWVIQLLYSAAFEPAADILRWQLLGVLGRVISWPLGFVLLAKGRAKIFFWTEFAGSVVHVSLIWLGMHWFGLSGLGMAFFGLYLFHTALMLVVVQRLTAFRWSRGNLRLGTAALAAIALVFLVGTGILPVGWPEALGGLLTLLAVLLAFQQLARRAGFADVWSAVQGIGDRIRSPRR